MEIRLIDDPSQWDAFVSSQNFAQFLQSWAWGEFQKSIHRRVWRVGFFENGALVGAAQIIEHYLGLGWAYLYCPRGPILKIPNPHNQFPINELTNFLKEKTSAYGEIFLRLEPQNIEYLLSNIPVHRVRSVQPAHVFLLDLNKPEEELLKNMHEKTRYNIRLAERKQLEVEIKNSEPGVASDDFERFWNLLQETSKRDDIRLHHKNYYQKMVQYVPCSMFHVSSGDQWLAAGLFIGFGDTFTYVHGGSSNEHRELMAPYLMQWSAIKLAKANGYRYYDFGGVNPEKTSDPDFRAKWAGITRFKKGFASQASPDRSVGSGFIKSYAGTYDLPINNLGYKLYRILKKII